MQSGYRIALVGPSGAGKTTAARWAARNEGYFDRWFDSDEAIAQHFTMPTAHAAFAHHGEAVFRRAEHAIISQAASDSPIGCEIWSLGAGSILSADVAKIVRDSCNIVICCDQDTDVLWERLSGGDRPLIQQGREAFEQQCATRRHAAIGIADHVAIGSERIRSCIESAVVEMHDLFDTAGLIQGKHLHRFVGELCAWHDAEIFIVCDSAASVVAEPYIAAMNDAGMVRDVFYIHGGEACKTGDTVASIHERWLSSGVRRSSHIVAIGGGTVTDVVGYAAATMLRGISWSAIATTTTGQAGAAIGGKTGINLQTRKNIVGAFHEPKLVVCDQAVLTTLSPEVAAEGLVEVVKTVLLAESGATQLMGSAELHSWDEQIARSARYKRSIVRADPHEQHGIRDQLNLGHTVGHAIESVCLGAMSHGACVAIGLVIALRLSEEAYGLAPENRNCVATVLTQLGCDLQLPASPAAITAAMQFDKKHDANGIAWVLLRSPGDPQTRVRLSAQTAEQAILAHADEYGTIAAVARNAQHRLLVLLGVNLGMLGKRDPELYGVGTVQDLVNQLRAWGNEAAVQVTTLQTDRLDQYVAALHSASATFDGVICNPGAWSHYELAIRDAVEICSVPVMEVHQSDIERREVFRHRTVIEDIVEFRSCGAGIFGYQDAIQWFALQRSVTNE